MNLGNITNKIPSINSVDIIRDIGLLLGSVFKIIITRINNSKIFVIFITSKILYMIGEKYGRKC